MSEYDDSDEATGLPPINEPDRDSGMILTSHDVSMEGIVAHPKGETPVIYLSVRGLVKDTRAESGVGWAQFHVGIPLDRIEDIVGDLLPHMPLHSNPSDKIMKPGRCSACGGEAEQGPTGGWWHMLMSCGRPGATFIPST